MYNFSRGHTLLLAPSILYKFCYSLQKKPSQFHLKILNGHFEMDNNWVKLIFFPKLCPYIDDFGAKFQLLGQALLEI